MGSWQKLTFSHISFIDVNEDTRMCINYVRARKGVWPLEHILPASLPLTSTN